MPTYLLINSGQRQTDSSSSTDFYVRFSQHVANVRKVKLDWVQIPLAIYQITSSNNTIYFRENSTNKTATLTAGYYNANDLGVELATQLNTASGGFATFTVTFNSSTYKFTIVSTQSFSLQWSLGGPNLAFGYPAADTPMNTNTRSIQSCQINSPLGVGLSIREFDTPTLTGGNSFYSTFKFYLEASIGSISTYDPKKEYAVEFPTTSFSELHIKVTDFEGNVIDINNHDWSMHLTVYTIYDKD